MNGQKYCENCGAVNLEDDEFCTNCGNRFASASTSPPPTPPPYTSPGSSDDQSPYAPSPKPQRRFKKRHVLYGVVVLFLVASVASAFSGLSSQLASTSLNTPTPTIQAPTAQVTTTPQATANPTATPTPQAGRPLATQVTMAPSSGASVAQGRAITFTTTLYSVNEHKNVCGAVNYYIDNNPAGGTWNINPPGTCSASSGSLSLAGADTAKLSPGTHTLKIDWLGDSTYGPAQYVEQFTVTS
jgi:hypothetical protein